MNRFTVSEMFSDHAVLRHSRPNPVWGTAPAGARVEVRLGDAHCECFADEQGRWMTSVETPGPGTIFTLEVRCGDEAVAFRDVASGEVWLAGGQSNMEMPVMCVSGGRALAEAEVYPNVRLKTISRRARSFRQYGWHFYPMDGSDSDWKLPDRESVARFSAIGYQFGALLSESLGMPVGIIDCNWGGTKIQSWIPTDVLRAHEDTLADLTRYEALQQHRGEKGVKIFNRFQNSIRNIEIDLDDFITRSLECPTYHCTLEKQLVDNLEGAEGDPNMPGCLFENMIARVAPFSIRGALWYQGESNTNPGEPERYASLFARMRKSWQRAWNDPELAFLTCQLSTFDPSVWGTFDWNTLRLQQVKCTGLPGVSMAVLADIGDEKDIHPLRKIPVAERLHALAMEDVYGAPCDAHSPAPVGCTVEGSAVRLRFDKPIELRGGELPKLITAEGPVPYTVSLEDAHTLLLTAEEGASVTAAEYAAKAWFVPSIFGTNGLPVSPFYMEA